VPLQLDVSYITINNFSRNSKTWGCEYWSRWCSASTSTSTGG